jgi:hypothetical protein
MLLRRAMLIFLAIDMVVVYWFYRPPLFDVAVMFGIGAFLALLAAGMSKK